MPTNVNRFDVTLDSPTGIYRPGETIVGHVVVHVTRQLQINGIHVWVLGQTEVSWTDKPGGRKVHFDYEIYMKDCITLCGRAPNQRGPTSEDKPILPAGQHDYTFEYKLPDVLPTSFESCHAYKGKVYYLLKARLDSSEEKVRQSKDRTFIVLSSLDLNSYPRCAELVQVKREKHLGCCCCCRCGSITCLLRLDRTGYVPGEDINVDAELQNHSKKEITASYVTMQQIVTLEAGGVSKQSTADIFRISGGKIKSGGSALYHDIIHIPPLPPSRLDGCNLVQIDYVITVGVLPSGMNDSIEISVPILIGTEPLLHVIPPGITVGPSYSRYSHSSGEIEDYSAEDYVRGKYQHVYTYYKALYRRAVTQDGECIS